MDEVVPGGSRSPAAGRGLEKYHPIATLGRGGMAEVLLAASASAARLYKLVVLKRLRCEFARDSAFVEMFLHEASLATRLNHPNVVQTFEFGEDGGEYFLAMEYLEGRSLCDVIKQLAATGEAVHPALAAFIVAEALCGLHYAHELRDYDGAPLHIVHRDISPQNILVTYEGQVKLVDFGIAKATQAPETQAGLLKGKLMYMAPEMASPSFGPTLDRRADLFAMGIVLWELLAGRRMFTGDTRDTFARLLNGAALPRVETVKPDVDPVLSSITECALRKARDLRFPTAQAMRDALEGFFAAHGHHTLRDQLGALMSRIFAGERAALQRKIRESMAALESSTRALAVAQKTPGGGATALARLPGPPPRPPSEGSIEVDVDSSSLSPPESPTEVEPPPVRRGRRIGLLTGSLVGAVILIAGLVVVRRSRVDAGGPLVDDRGAGTAASVRPPEIDSPPAATPTPVIAPPVDSPPPVAPRASVAPGRAAPSPLAQPPPRTVRPSSVAQSPPAPKNTAGVAAAQPPVAPEPSGFLTLDTYPWSQVSENGHPLGTTPLVGVPLSAGPHVLTLDNPDQQMHRSYVVTIKSGETVARRLAFQ